MPGSRISVTGIYLGAQHASRHQLGAVDALSPTLDVGGPIGGAAVRYFVTVAGVAEANPRMQLTSGYLQGFPNGAGANNSVLVDFVNRNIQLFDAAVVRRTLIEPGTITVYDAAAQERAKISEVAGGYRIGLTNPAGVQRVTIGEASLVYADAAGQNRWLIDSTNGNIQGINAAGVQRVYIDEFQATLRDAAGNQTALLGSDGTLRLGTIPAASGQIRLPTQQWIAARNAANGADLNLIQANASDRLQFGSDLEGGYTARAAPQGLGSAVGPNVSADAVNTLRDSPFVRLTARYWDGAASQDRNANWLHEMITAGGTPGSALAAVIAGSTIGRFRNDNGTLSLSLGSIPATAGVLRLPNAQWINSRNAANNADLTLVRASAADLLEFGINVAGYIMGGNINANGQNITGVNILEMSGSAAVSGKARFGNAQWITYRNAANNADINLWQVDASDRIAGGAAPVLLNQQLYPSTDALATQTACAVFAGTGVPNNANGANGDIYLRSDGGALTTIYQRRAGAWVGIV